MIGNNITQLQSFAPYKFVSAKFTSLLKYRFDEEPTLIKIKITSPLQTIVLKFKKGNRNILKYVAQSSNKKSFASCGHCEKYICCNHFFGMNSVSKYYVIIINLWLCNKYNKNSIILIPLAATAFQYTKFSILSQKLSL